MQGISGRGQQRETGHVVHISWLLHHLSHNPPAILKLGVDAIQIMTPRHHRQSRHSDFHPSPPVTPSVSRQIWAWAHQNANHAIRVSTSHHQARYWLKGRRALGPSPPVTSRGLPPVIAHCAIACRKGRVWAHRQQSRQSGFRQSPPVTPLAPDR